MPWWILHFLLFMSWWILHCLLFTSWQILHCLLFMSWWILHCLLFMFNEFYTVYCSCLDEFYILYCSCLGEFYTASCSSFTAYLVSCLNFAIHPSLCSIFSVQKVNATDQPLTGKLRWKVKSYWNICPKINKYSHSLELLFCRKSHR